MIDYVTTCLMHKMSKHKEKKPQGEDAHGIATKQQLQLISMPRRKFILPLQQTISYYVFCYKTKNNDWKFVKKNNIGQHQLRICNEWWSTFQNHVWVDHGFGSFQRHEFV